MLKLFFYLAVLLIAFFGYTRYSLAENNKLQIGDDAPNFSLNDAEGNVHHLSDYAGNYLVLYFYPKDDTPGCTKEACHFRDDIGPLEKLGAKVVGISVDSTQSHANFIKKYKLPFPLLADGDGAVANAYNALTNLYLFKIAKRYTYLISPAGKIGKIYKNVDSSNHSQEIIADLKVMQSQQ